MTDEDSARLRIVDIPYEFLAGVLSGKLEIVVGIPADAKVTAVFEEPFRRMVRVRVQSMEFKPVPDGNLIDSFSVKVRAK